MRGKMNIRKEIQVMTGNQLNSILSNIKMVNTSVFAVNWRYEVMIVEAQGALKAGWMVRIAFERPDTTTGIMGTGYGRWEYIAEGTWESGVVKTGWVLLEFLLKHEFMESFRYMGARIFNPHHGVLELASLEREHAH